ncbi:MAG: DUF805 domain-containing protein [Leptospiraceae bacterium]|nr:DUF805 domain-containing protein [Leptospiraceae bacterium]MCB1314934.1 DUF805 domain-containing protein [Leptospiraceae bacterium]
MDLREPQDYSLKHNNPYQVTEINEMNRASAGWSAQKLGRYLFSFDGRATIGQWWLLHLGLPVALFLILGAGGILFQFLGTALSDLTDSPTPAKVLEVAGVIIIATCVLLYIWINLSVTVRRFHDRDKSGGWIFIGAIPYIGGFWILIECGFLPGTMGPNSYGPDPMKRTVN